MTNPPQPPEPSAEALAFSKEVLQTLCSTRNPVHAPIMAATLKVLSDYGTAYIAREYDKHLTAALRTAREENERLKSNWKTRVESDELIDQQTQDEIDALRLRVAELNQQLENAATDAAIRTGELFDLQTRNAELAQDRERLDWLERDCHSIDNDGMFAHVTAATTGQTYRGGDLREAIDAAMEANK